MLFLTEENFNLSLLLQKLHLQSGMHVADFGCGRSGHLVFSVAKKVGESGVVYAVDILKNVLKVIENQAKRDAHTHILPVWADIERVGSTSIPEGTLDMVFMVNVLHQINHKTNALYEAKRLLKQKGRIVIVDWKDCTLSIAPEEHMCVNMQEVETWARGQGFAVQEVFDMGEYHKGVILFRHE